MNGNFWIVRILDYSTPGQFILLTFYKCGLT